MYTCNSCSLQFPTAEDQRSHMKSDWHRYNLKRRVANLPAINEEMFNEKVKKISLEEEEANSQMSAKDKKISEKQKRRMEKEALLEKKRQLLQLARENILKSINQEKQENELNEAMEEVKIEDSKEDTKVKENEPKEEEEKVEEEEPKELTQEEEEELLIAEKLKNKVDIPLNVCMFCNKKYPNLKASLEHMYKKHGFYIPEIKYLTDLEGLVKYMSEKLSIGNVCFCCSYQGRSLEAIRAHITSKKHCRIPYESEDERLEISDFYDFSSTYTNIDKENEDEWEDVEEEGEEGEGEEEEEEEELPQQVSYDDGVELHLPTGLKVGHRSLARYFRQNLKPETVLTEGQGTVIAAESRHLVSAYNRSELIAKKRVWKNELHHKDRDDRRAAKFINNQPHYRDQLLQ